MGRTDEVAAISRLLDLARLVTLTGPPGVGKTSLALALAEGRDEVVWVDLAPVREPGQVVGEIARALGAAPGVRPEQLVVATDQDVLLVLDNCEHVLDGVAEVAGLLRSSARLRVLATSRERLRLSAEREFAVPPLPMPSEDTLDDLAALRQNPSIAMLLARAPDAVRLTPGTARSLAQICIGVDGLPLAIELAAARLRVFTPGELAFRIERRMALLTEGPRDAPARHRDLRAAIAWSHDLLSEVDRAAFRRLSVFPSQWSLAAAQAVCDDPRVLESLDSLLDKSLVRRVGPEGESPTEAGFTMLMSLREYAAEQLVEQDEVDATRDRHASWFAARARDWEHTVGTSDEAATWPELAEFRGDLRAAFEQARQRDDPERTTWLATALGWYSYLRGVLADAHPFLDVLLAARDEPRLSPDAVAAATMAAGVVAYGLGDLDEAEAALQKVARPESGEDERRAGVVVAFLGHVARERGQLDAAGAHYAAAATAYARAGNKRGTAWTNHDLALLALDEGRYADGERLLRDAVTLFDEMGYEWAVAVCACLLAGILAHRGAADEASVLVGRALVLHGRIGDRRGMAQCLEVVAEVSLLRGAPATAARLAGAAETLRGHAAARATDAEARRVAAVDRQAVLGLGPAGAEHERHAGRTMPLAAALELAARVARSPDGGGGEDGTDAVTLTARQQEVAALVAAGRTNRQIGRDLGISEKTAEIHVRNIMARLGVPSRAGVAVWAVSHDRHP